MTKDKLITVRIEKEKRDAFQEWSKKNKINGATFLYQIINLCIAGNISKDIINQNNDPNLELENIQSGIQKLSKKVEEKISKHEDEISNLRSDVSSLKILLSSQNKHKPSEIIDTQKLAKRIDNDNDNKSELLSDSQLAKKLNIAPATVNRWRTGKRKPSKKYSDIFDLYDVVDNKWRNKI